METFNKNKSTLEKYGSDEVSACPSFNMISYKNTAQGVVPIKVLAVLTPNMVLESRHVLNEPS